MVEVDIFAVVHLVEVVLLRAVVRLPVASCRRSRCGASKEAPLPVSVVSRVFTLIG